MTSSLPSHSLPGAGKQVRVTCHTHHSRSTSDGRSVRMPSEPERAEGERRGIKGAWRGGGGGGRRGRGRGRGREEGEGGAGEEEGRRNGERKED